MNLDMLAFDIHKINKEKGFYEGELTIDRIMAKLALVHSEVTETLEAIRKDKGDTAVVEEMADTIIRVLDIWAVLFLNHQGDELDSLFPSLETILLAKIEKNKNRPALHGHKWG
jgi:NTP pyrophosphatase (non-canonical NTP hydrolase)